MLRHHAPSPPLARLAATGLALLVWLLAIAACAPAPGLETQHVEDGACVASAAVPWQLSLARRGGDAWRHECGAVAIAPGWAITAAHCVTVADSGGVVRPGVLGIVAGVSRFAAFEVHPDRACRERPELCDESVVASCPWGPGTAESIPAVGHASHGIDVVEVVRHPGYCRHGIQPGSIEAHDLALLRLARPLPPSAIIDVSTSQEHDVLGKPLLITGWGQSLDYFAEPREFLQQGVTTASGYRSDSIESSSLTVEWIESDGSPNATSPGDSGGPVVEFADFEARQGPLLVGLVSMGAGDTDPALRVRISAYAPWIAAVLAGDFSGRGETMNCGEIVPSY